MGLRTGVSKGRNLFSFYYLIMCRSKGNIGNRDNVGVDQSTCTQVVDFLCVVYCTRHRYWGYRRLKRNQGPSVAWLSWKRGMQIYLQRISDKRENPKWEWPVWFWIALVRCSYLFVSVFLSDPTDPQSLWGWSDTFLVPGFRASPAPWYVSTFHVLCPPQQSGDGSLRMNKRGGFHSPCSVLSSGKGILISQELGASAEGVK